MPDEVPPNQACSAACDNGTAVTWRLLITSSAVIVGRLGNKLTIVSKEEKLKLTEFENVEVPTQRSLLIDRFSFP
jgi:hypothetical protein